MMRILLRLTSVSLKYFKVNWNKLEYTLIKYKIELQLKKEIQEMSLWLKMSFQREKHREEIQILM